MPLLYCLRKCLCFILPLFFISSCFKRDRKDIKASEITNFVGCPEHGLQHDESKEFLMFNKALVSFGESCESHTKAVMGRCDNGAIYYDNAIGVFESCEVASGLACSDVALLHGHTKTRKVYNTESVPFGETCEDHAATQTVSCDNGQASFDREDYPFLVCSVNEPAACEAAGLIEGQSKRVPGFKRQEVGFGLSCESEKGERILTCTGGQVVTESTEFKFDNCRVAEAKSCTDENLAHQEERVEIAYRLESAETAEACAAASGERKISCFDGKATIDIPELKYKTCQVTSLGCPSIGLKNGESKTSQGFRPQYFLDSVESCESNRGEIIRSCEEGQIKVDSGAEFAAGDCDVRGERLESQYWLFDSSGFRAPWKTQTPERFQSEATPSELAQACRVESEAALAEALGDKEVVNLLNKVFAEGGTQKLILVTTDTLNFSPMAKFDDRRIDRAAYFWHWNQDNRIPSVASSRYDKGTWVWESTLSKGICTHPTVSEMKRYLRYANERLVGFKILK